MRPNHSTSLETVTSQSSGVPENGLSVDAFDNLVSIERSGFAPVAFHTKNLEVASISREALQVLKSGRFSETEGAAAEIEAWSHSTNPEVKSGKIKFGARSVTVNVTQICNLHCSYCAAGGDGTFGDPVKKISVDKTIPQLAALLEKVPVGEKFTVTFLGGEPLLYPEGIRILGEYVQDFARASGIEAHFRVVTNGTHFSPANVQLLCELGASVTVSIDGSEEVNDRTRPTRGGQGVTAKVAEGTRLLLKRKSELGSVEFSGVFGKHNPDLMAAYEFYRGFEVDGFDFTYDHLEKSAEVSQAFTHALTAVADRAFAEGGERELRRILHFDRIFETLDKQQQVENFCGAGKSYFMIDARNAIYTCPWVAGDSKEVVGHGVDLWTERLKRYEAPLIEANGCGQCWARYVCGGGCMYIHKNKTGDKNQVDDNFCKRTKDLIALGISYYQLARTGAEPQEQETL